jgi:hypothetical protein
MSIKEFTFVPALEITGDPMKVTADSIKEALILGLPTAVRRVLPQGESTVTDHRWQIPTHDWIIHVRKDGTGVLTITPRDRSSKLSHIGTNLPPSAGMTTILNSPDKARVLSGVQLNTSDQEVFTIFKAFQYNPD